MLHGTEPCVFFMLHHKNLYEVSLLTAIEDVLDFNQKDIVFFVCDIKHPNSLVNNPHLFFQ